jgi:hypothetical protein
LPALAKAKAKAQAMNCVKNVKQLNLAMLMYANDNKDTLPSANNWGDAINQYAGSPRVFQCPAARGVQRSHYAFNAKLAGLTLDKINPSTVMLFECKGGWNVSGGASEMSDHHFRLYVVGLADGSAQQVSEARLTTLRWDP